MTTTKTTSYSREFISILNDNGFLQERLPGDKLALPHNFESIKIKPNEFILDVTINRCIEKIHQNWLYLTSSSVIPTNNIPNTDFTDNMIIDKGLGIQWSSQDDFNFSSFDSDLSDVKKILKIQNNIDESVFNLVATTTTNIILLSGTDSNVDVIVNPDSPGGVIRSDSSITHPSNNIFFENIIDINTNTNKDLFVLDGNHNIIFKFDLSGLVSLDDAILLNDTPGRLLTRTVGGTGLLADKTKFINPVCFTIVDNLIYVVDMDPTSKEINIKCFDSHLNWKSSFSLGVLSISDVKDIEFNTSTNNFYILSHNIDNDAIISIFNKSFEVVDQQPLIDANKYNSQILSEDFKKISFSVENPNIMYIVTDKNVYKKYVSRPGAFIGSFQFSNPTTGNIGPDENVRNLSDLIIFPERRSVGGLDVVKDEILLLEYNRSGIYQFFEDSGFQNSIEYPIDLKYIEFNNIRIKQNENVDALTYNKCLNKMLFNNLLLLENTSRRFSTAFNSSGFSIYMGFKYLTTSELETLKYNITPNNYVGMNEVVLTSTINRCLNEMFQLQQNILTIMSEKSLNVYPLPSMTVVL